MTTHDFSMLPRYADRVVLIDHEVKCQGTAAEVLDSQAFRTAFHMKEGHA
jgi:ABC-type Mn2+/Zn2+ transport system ATPase subunit